MRDQASNLKIVRLFTPLVQNNADTAFVSAIIDRLNFDALTLVFQTGTCTDAGFTSVVLVEDADEVGFNVTNAAVADQFLIGTEVGAAITQANDLVTSKIGYVGGKRFVRVTVTPTGNAAGDIPFAGVAILGHPNTAPQSTQIV